MRRWVVLSCLALAALGSAQSQWLRYRVYPNTDEEAQRVSDSSLGLFSDNVTMGGTDVIVAPGKYKDLAALRLPARFISVLPDPRNWAETHPQPRAGDFTDTYFTYDQVIAQYEAWRTTYPDIVSRTLVGTTYNGRQIWAYRFYGPTSGDRQVQRSVVTICGIHAREWISPAVGMYVFYQLIQSYFTRTGFAQRYPANTAFYVIPSINPQGFDYTWSNDRMWRKNRRNNGSGSFGVDLNRNFSKGYGLNSGSSSNTNSETYRGPAAFSEPESTAFKNWLNTITPVAAFMDFHSYGQYVLWSWGYQSPLAPGDSWLRSTGMAMKTAVDATNGMTYTPGPCSTTLYLASGVTPDYMYDRYNTPAYTIELRDTGQNGFLLPAAQIHDTQIEAWNGWQEMVAHMMDR